MESFVLYNSLLFLGIKVRLGFPWKLVRDLVILVFLHTAFTFGFDAGVNNSQIDGNLVPPAALAKNDLDEDFISLQPMDLITKDVYELQKIVKDKKKNQHVDGELDKENEESSCSVKDFSN
ncbi:UNVERIFIED_CONTAM: WD40 repeat-containing protein HOS15 [Sesamum radiatum]|uniref:WD40 repeat-containing protein HOS15 n=1 Tax=Sesamum radiatum TaxID=300843 RepID=A0AAW2RCG2_SESRA